MPASRRPRASTPEPSEATSAVAWSSSPVSRAAAVNPAPRAPISASDTSVPSTAVDVRADNPCVRYSTANMITPAPTTATASGLRPSRIAGRTNSSSTPKLTTSAPRAASPRHRPRTSTAAENSTASQASDPPRWKSTIWYEPGSSGSPPDQPSTTGSPTVNRGVPGSIGHELDQVAAGARARPSSRRRARRIVPARRRGSSRWPRRRSPGRAPAAAAPCAGGGRRAARWAGGRRGRPGRRGHRARAARRAAPGPDGPPARPARARARARPVPCPDAGLGLAVRPWIGLARRDPGDRGPRRRRVRPTARSVARRRRGHAVLRPTARPGRGPQRVGSPAHPARDPVDVRRRPSGRRRSRRALRRCPHAAPPHGRRPGRGRPASRGARERLQRTVGHGVRTPSVSTRTPGSSSARGSSVSSWLRSSAGGMYS